MQIKLSMVLLALSCINASAQWVDNSKPSNPSGDVYANGEALAAGQSVNGVVLDVRRVRLEPDAAKKIAGTTAGAAIGGLAGVRASGTAEGKMAGVAVGSIFGGWLGGAAATQIASQEAMEIIVQTSDGRAVVVVQAVSGGESLSIGQKVFVINVRGNSRVVRASS